VLEVLLYGTGLGAVTNPLFEYCGSALFSAAPTLWYIACDGICDASA